MKARRDADRRAASTLNAEARCTELESQVMKLTHALDQSEDERLNVESHCMMESDRADDAEERAGSAESAREMMQYEVLEHRRKAEEADVEISELYGLVETANRETLLMLRQLKART